MRLPRRQEAQQREGELGQRARARLQCKGLASVCSVWRQTGQQYGEKLARNSLQSAQTPRAKGTSAHSAVRISWVLPRPSLQGADTPRPSLQGPLPQKHLRTEPMLLMFKAETFLKSLVQQRFWKSTYLKTRVLLRSNAAQRPGTNQSSKSSCCFRSTLVRVYLGFVLK